MIDYVGIFCVKIKVACIFNKNLVVSRALGRKLLSIEEETI